MLDGRAAIIHRRMAVPAMYREPMHRPAVVVVLIVLIGCGGTQPTAPPIVLHSDFGFSSVVGGPAPDAQRPGSRDAAELVGLQLQLLRTRKPMEPPLEVARSWSDSSHRPDAGLLYSI